MHVLRRRFSIFVVRSSKVLPRLGPSKIVRNGKKLPAFFETKEQAQKFILETKRSGSVELAELAVEEKHVLGVIRQSEKYEPKLLLEAWRRFESEGKSTGSNLTVLQLCEKFFARQIAERRSSQTLGEDRWRLLIFLIRRVRTNLQNGC
jgi:hypothetical protein